ncbi:excalibur calcium-binding domain-containing protein [Lysobacter sp. LF1]|uniref:Excalibur calcium-binding domain-containing protein n=1 Tax=Lysobacter stagni TaxID=3045172 RepID=A0ABT6XCB1_9GAMM|nr:excalibur calcium-binding domain-containing protein [Lysobacter sp. LF1]MDI9237780.1 excalibur calcium-binding domain-containing protein [Lysobacter sp. LF1]
MGKWIIAALALACADVTWAHGGGLDRNGCHHDRKNGGYHCHRGASAAPSNDARPASFTHTLQPADARSVGFRNCSEARAAGAAPVRRGDPGYGRHLDRDGDGVGCE